MKYIFTLLVATMAIVSTASAATGSTSTGSTAPALTCQTGLPCAGGPTRGWNYTTNDWDMVPQCFPWTWYTRFLVGNISDIYTNQEICRAKRAADFHL